jgi:predicted AAA+ superfamily ATPase
MMSKSTAPPFIRPAARILADRLDEPRRFIQVVAGPRQVGKTTLVQQILDRTRRPHHSVSADEPTMRDASWLRAQWDVARRLTDPPDGAPAILVIDEIQRVADWAEVVKHSWDQDTRAGRPLHVVLLGSAPLLVESGLDESLAGRFERIQLGHWSYPEMRDAFGFGLDQYIYFGGYPGAAPLVGDQARWRRYILDSLVETTIARDVLLLTRVDKPALLRRLFELSCRYSGQILSYTKMLGQLQDAGNTTTLAHYLDLLAGVGMVAGLPKFAGQAVRRRASSPKLQVLNNALLAVQSGLTMDAVRRDGEQWGRFVESAVGGYLATIAHGASAPAQLGYWRDRGREVDFVLRRGREVVAIEVKSARGGRPPSGLAAFDAAFQPTRSYLVGADGMPLEEFFSTPVEAL